MNQSSLFTVAQSQHISQPSIIAPKIPKVVQGLQLTVLSYEDKVSLWTVVVSFAQVELDTPMLPL